MAPVSDSIASDAQGSPGARLFPRGTAADVGISRMSDPEVMRIRVEVAGQVLEVEMGLAEFALAVTGRGATPATVVRHFARKR